MNPVNTFSAKAGQLITSRFPTSTRLASCSNSRQVSRRLSRAFTQYRNCDRTTCRYKYKEQQRNFASDGGARRNASQRTPAHQRDAKLATKDRGPRSREDTVTDFAALNVLGQTPNPSTSVDVCNFDGFGLDSGLRITDGDGVILLGLEAFVWRPWMAAELVRDGSKVVTGNSLRTAASKSVNESVRTGGIVNAKGQWEIPDAAWGVFNAIAPKPDLLIIGTGPSIRPLAPATRDYLQKLGMRIEVLDTRNAASQFNLLATERGVDDIAAALVPIGFGVK